MAPAATAALRTGQKSGKERMELGHAILWNIDRDRLVLRSGRDFPIHVYSLSLLTLASLAQVNT
jgi:hypothetical protein